MTDLAMKLAMSIAPEASSTYGAASAGMIAMLMQCLAEDYDRGAEMRLRDITELKSLFADADVDDTALQSDLDAFAPAEPESLRIAHLDTLHATALELLIRLHADAERRGDVDLDGRIWAFLERYAERHAYHVGGA